MAESNRHLRSKPFIIPENPLKIGRAWEDWLDGIEREFRYFKITDPTDKEDALLIYGGQELVRLHKTLPATQIEAGGEPDVYNQLKSKLNNHFKPQFNKEHARYVFLKMRPNPMEATNVYATRLREQAAECKFEATEEDRILEHLIQTIGNKRLIKKAITKKMTLTQFLQEATQEEETVRQLQDMDQDRDSTEGGTIAKLQSHFRKDRVFGNRPRSKERFRRTTNSVQDRSCNYCGMQNKHKPGEGCPAYGKRCKNCDKLHHFAAVCKSSVYQREQKRRVKKTEQESASESSSDDEFVIKHVSQSKLCKKVKQKEKTIEIQINDVRVRAEPDTGADVNIMDKYQFRALRNRSDTDINLNESKMDLKTLNSKLQVKGEFEATIRNATRGSHQKFVVIDERIDSFPLLCKNTLEELGMMEIREDGSLKEENNMKIKVVKGNSVEEIVNKHANVFHGVGKIKDMSAKFIMKPDAVPVAQKPRNVPYYLQRPLKEWLDRNIEDGLFERVPENEAITWCSPLVVQPKPKYKDTDKDKIEAHMIRPSIDLRIPNKYMERSKITPSPIVEDFTHKFHDCTIFSSMDMNQGYNQLELDENSRGIATFSTPWGNVRPKRLIFGAKSSQDAFDEAVYKVFGDIPYCLNQRDDILIGGRTLEEHNETLDKVLSRAEEYGVTFNKEKCKFARKEIEFFGFKFAAGCIKPTQDKVKAINECTAPKSKEEIRSFLGMTGYLSKFIPRYSDLTAPLRELTKKETKFMWTQEQQNAFQKLKDSITSQSTIAFFNPALPIVLRCEASFHEGLSAGLFQETDEGLKPVHFISRSLTDTEKRYSQTEKDALSIAWAKDRLRMYLLGAPRFKIITSHKPLIPLFSKPAAKLPPRIEKWVMNLQDVDYEIIYVPGKDEADPLDYLSRHPLPHAEDDNVESRVKAVIEQHAVMMNEIKMETMKDSQMQKIKDRITNADWENYRRDLDVQPFLSVSKELYVAEGVIFRLQQVVIPRSLQRKVIRAAHSQGHLGMSKLKQMLREKYWFPEMNMLIESFVGECFECQVTTKQTRSEPVKLMTIPSEPWDVLSVDFGGPYEDGHYNFVVVDKRTRYVEVERVYTTSAKSTTKKLLKIFATHGIPKIIESDNGPPFNSVEFNEFLTEHGIKHHRVTPLHPRANGEAESFMRLLNKTESIAKLTGDESERAISRMLMGYRSTPHPATKVTPYRALMNRDIRTKIDHENIIAKQVQESQETTSTNKIDEHDQEYKKKMKEYADKNTVKRHFVIGDHVLVKQPKKHKLSTAYEPRFYVITEINGSSIKARRISDNKMIHRDASHFKLANALLDSKEVPTVFYDNLPDQDLQDLQEDEVQNENTAPTEDELDQARQVQPPYPQDTIDDPRMAGEGQGHNPSDVGIPTGQEPLRRSTRIHKPVVKLNL